MTYCKSQNTKNEQQKDLCITSEQLTEQWKKGELPSGEYYIIDDLGLHTTDRYYPSHGFGTELPQSVLGRVPSYEEYERLNWYAGNGVEENQELKMENAQLKERNDSLNNRDINLCRIANGIRDENFALKELLKECKRQFEEVELYRYDVVDTDQEDWFKISTEQAGIANKMIAKINQILGEE